MAGAATGQVPGSVETEIDEVQQGQGFGQGERVRQRQPVRRMLPLDRVVRDQPR